MEVRPCVYIVEQKHDAQRAGQPQEAPHRGGVQSQFQALTVLADLQEGLEQAERQHRQIEHPEPPQYGAVAVEGKEADQIGLEMAHEHPHHQRKAARLRQGIGEALGIGSRPLAGEQINADDKA